MVFSGLPVTHFFLIVMGDGLYSKIMVKCLFMWEGGRVNGER